MELDFVQKYYAKKTLPSPGLSPPHCNPRVLRLSDPLRTQCVCVLEMGSLGAYVGLGIT